jgi:LysR family transcriptional regulator, chromosome initiation inhibitor
MLNYDHLMSLLAVARYGSFEAAARELKVTPSAVSQRVKLLEERTGSLLIVRGQPCVPTTSGALLCRHVERVRFLEVELNEAFPLPARDGEDNDAPWLPLRVAVNYDSVGTWFIDAVAGVCRRRRILLDIVVDDAERTMQRIREGSVQGAVTSQAEPISGCHAIHLGRMDYVPVCAPSFAQRFFAAGVDRDALAVAPRIDLSGVSSLAQRFARSITHAPIEPPVHMIPNVSGLLRACLHGMGWGVLPVHVATPHIDHGELVCFAPERFFSIELYWHSWNVAINTLEEFGIALRDAFAR